MSVRTGSIAMKPIQIRTNGTGIMRTPRRPKRVFAQGMPRTRNMCAVKRGKAMEVMFPVVRDE